MGEITLYTQKIFEETIMPVKEKALSLMDQKQFIRECGFAMQLINANKQLIGADKMSIMQAVYNVALTGLTLNPVLKQAYLVPRFTGGKVVVTLEPSSQGLVKLITDTGSVTNVYAFLVYVGDDFDTILGTSVEIIHRPKYKSQDITHVYAVAILTDGSKQFEVMTLEQINEIRDRSESYKAFMDKKIKSCIWADHYGEMARKTVIKRLVKYVPKSNKWEKVSHAIDVDNVDYKPSYGQINWVEGLINTSAFDDDTKQTLLEKLNDNSITQSEFDNLKTEVLNNQLDRISSGMNYTQTDIKNKIAAEVK